MRKGWARPVIVGSLAFIASGCAGAMQSQKVAVNSAALLNDYRREVDQFAVGQNALNADIDRRIRALDAITARLRADNDQRIGAISASDDKRASTLIQSFANPPFNDVVAQSRVLEGLEPVAASSSVRFDSSKIQALVRQLNSISQEPKFVERLEGIYSYWTSLREAYEASIAEAKSEAEATDAPNAEAHQEVVELSQETEGSSRHD